MRALIRIIEGRLLVLRAHPKQINEQKYIIAILAAALGQGPSRT